jgi:hypothetical protein
LRRSRQRIYPKPTAIAIRNKYGVRLFGGADGSFRVTALGNNMEPLLWRAFWVSLLLSGDAGVAEEVIQEAIEFLDAEDLYSDALLIFVTTFSLQLHGDEPVQPTLPEELRNVMRLPRMQRQCFVLRILLHWPEARCARLLHAEEHQISNAVLEAVSRLSFVAVNA